ncbi:MAG TPA: DUF11 domain-containing protein [Candidatus Saccharimonadales bacterium]|nr:DUF11 domain-containing protein [Candidatus Saccharimonadales bacterium]
MGKHRFALLLATLVVTAATVAAFAAPALAWSAPSGSGKATCNQTSGNYDVTWTITNTESEDFVVDASNRSAIQPGDSVPAGGHRDFPDTLPGNTTGTTSLMVTGGYHDDAGPYPVTASVTTDGKCATPPSKCTDKSATNYGQPAPCTYPPTPKCTDKSASNYGSSAPCTYPPPSYCQATPSADVGVVKTADKSSLAIGDMVTYTVDVFNNGPCDAPNVTFSDVLPSQLELLNPQAVSDSRCSITGGVGSQTINCNFGTVATGQHIKVTVAARADTAGTVSNKACVGTTVADWNVGDNQCSTSTVTVTAPPQATPPAVTPPTKPKPAPKPKPKPPVVKHHPKPKPAPKPHHPKKHPKPHKPAAPKYTP